MPCTNPKVFQGCVISCKSCDWCLGIKRWLYRSRILAEQSVAEKTWFVTLTLRRSLSDQVAYALVQRWLKRMRKALPDASLRYACVAERGSRSTRRLHYHVVLHGPARLTYRVVRNAWRGGISETSLVENGNDAATYATKMASYTTKSDAGRFRFSIGYGRKALASVWENPIVTAALQFWPTADLGLRVHGSRVHRGVLPDRPAPEFLIGSELWLESETCRPGPVVRSKKRFIPMKQG